MNNKLYCKICNKEIKGCKTCEGKIFNWRNVACSISHYQEYVLKILEERNKSK